MRTSKSEEEERGRGAFVPILRSLRTLGTLVRQDSLYKQVVWKMFGKIHPASDNGSKPCWTLRTRSHKLCRQEQWETQSWMKQNCDLNLFQARATQIRK